MKRSGVYICLIKINETQRLTRKHWCLMQCSTVFETVSPCKLVPGNGTGIYGEHVCKNTMKFLKGWLYRIRPPDLFRGPGKNFLSRALSPPHPPVKQDYFIPFNSIPPPPVWEALDRMLNNYSSQPSQI